MRTACFRVMAKGYGPLSEYSTYTSDDLTQEKEHMLASLKSEADAVRYIEDLPSTPWLEGFEIRIDKVWVVKP